MPVETKPEDKPARVRFHRDKKGAALEIVCELTPGQDTAPFTVEGGKPRYSSLDGLKAKVVEVGMSPAVAEDPSRSFNATARQLRQLGFDVDVKKDTA